jgi:membrane protein
VSLLASVVFLTGVFGLAFKALPKATVQWSDVWIGAVISAIGFAISKYLLSTYFAYAGVAAAYGSAGALVIVLLWIYYTSQIFFFGFEVTNTYAYLYGSKSNDKSMRDATYS